MKWLKNWMQKRHDRMEAAIERSIKVNMGELVR